MGEVVTKQEQIEQSEIDGINREFSTVLPYVPGSVRCFTPTLARAEFVEEIGGDLVRLAEAPLLGDVWILHYNHE